MFPAGRRTRHRAGPRRWPTSARPSVASGDRRRRARDRRRRSRRSSAGGSGASTIQPRISAPAAGERADVVDVERRQARARCARSSRFVREELAKRRTPSWRIRRARARPRRRAGRSSRRATRSCRRPRSTSPIRRRSNAIDPSCLLMPCSPDLRCTSLRARKYAAQNRAILRVRRRIDESAACNERTNPPKRVSGIAIGAGSGRVAAAELVGARRLVRPVRRIVRSSLSPLDSASGCADPPMPVLAPSPRGEACDRDRDAIP